MYYFLNNVPNRDAMINDYSILSLHNCYRFSRFRGFVIFVFVNPNFIHFGIAYPERWGYLLCFSKYLFDKCQGI